MTPPNQSTKNNSAGSGTNEEKTTKQILPDKSNASPPPTSNSTLGFIDKLSDMERVKTIGELSEFNQALNHFHQRQLSSYDPATPPPDRETLLKQWEKEFSKSWSRPETEFLAQYQTQNKITATEIELQKNHALGQIDSARSAWDRQLGEARLTGDSETIQQWESLGKGIFYAENEEERQKTLSSRFNFLNQFNASLSSDPAEALNLLKDDNPESACVPQTVKEFMTTRAKSVLAEKQELFSRSLIENELKGTPFREDALELAVEKKYFTPQQAQLYKERFSEDRPLKNNESLKLPLLNQTRELINTYDPENDIRGERKRSIYSLIASADYDRTEKRELLKQFDQQVNNPPLGKLRQKASGYLNELFEKNGLGAYTSQKNEESGIKKDQWLLSQKKLNAAQNAINQFLESRPDKLPSSIEWEKELPRIVYKAVREPKTINFDNLSMVAGYPFLSSQQEQTGTAPAANVEAEAKTESPASLSDSWEDTLDNYFSHAKQSSSSKLKEELNTLFHNWLDHRKSARAPKS